MTNRTQELRSKWLMPVLIFLAGLLVGWLVIGWGVWPVSYKNSLPVDLRPAERYEYLLMAADSYANSGDIDQVRQRLSSWSEAEKSADFDRLIEALSTNNAAQAAAVQRLARDLGVPIGAEAPASGAAPPLAPGTDTQPAGIPAALRTVCTAGLWIVLVLVGIAAIVLIYRRWRDRPPHGEVPVPPAVMASQQPSASVYPGSAAPVAGTVPTAWSVDDIAADAKQEWPEADEDFDLDEAGQTSAPTEPSSPASQSATRVPASGQTHETPTDRASVAPTRSGPQTRPVQTAAQPPWRPPAASVGRSPATGTPAGPVKIGEFEAVYRMGEPDYDEAFDLYDEQGQYVGQCGLGLTTPVGRAGDQAAALQVWLWDTNDPDTQVKILMSEAAYRETALRDQLSGEHTAVSIRRGSEFELESYSLMLRGVVEKLDFAEQETTLGVFAELVVRLRAYRREQAL